MEVLLVGGEVLGQRLGPGRGQRDLDLRRAAVIGGSSVGLYDFPLTGCWKRHSEFLLSLFPLSLADKINRPGRRCKGRGENEEKEMRNLLRFRASRWANRKTSRTTFCSEIKCGIMALG